MPQGKSEKEEKEHQNGCLLLFPTPVSTESGSKGLSQFFSEYP